MPRKRLADQLIQGLTDLRDALRDGRKMTQTVLVRCEKCGLPVRAKETKGGWCPACNGSAPCEGDNHVKRE